jgi:hypothetical protein
MALVVRPIISPHFEKLNMFGFLGRAAAVDTYEGVFYAYIHNVRAHRDLITGYSLVETDSRSETITPIAL